MDMKASNRAVLEVRGLTKRFGGLTAVKNLGFEVNSGEIFGLIGPNGSGKSTAMKSVMGIERPTAGEVIFEGENVAGLPAHKIARKGFGMVFQHSRPLNRQTVLENIMVALLPDSLFMLFPDKALVERAKWIADRVGLGAVMNRRPPTLPFADLRRLELAKAIARDPKVVLVDEPFAGLTRGEVDVFSDLIRSFRDEGRAVMLVDHNVKSVAALVDRVLAMYLGEEIVTGKAEDVMKNETVRRGLSRRRYRDPRAARDQLQGQGAAAPGRECQRVLWQGAGAGERLDPRPRGRIRLDRRPQRRRQDHAVQHHLRLPAL
ncbi:ABC-type branched-subunit amino acid transport system ATPase component [Bradyrhizobium sp. LM2.3]